MRSRLHLDIETYSECDLGAAGVYKYAEDESTEILCFSYAFDDEPVQSWRPGHPLPVGIYLAGGISAISYIADNWALAPLALGSFFGTYWAVKRVEAA